MSHATAVFQNQLNELLIGLNLDDVEFAPEQDCLSLLVDERFSVHCSLINDDMWMIEAELATPVACDARLAQDALLLNAPSGRPRQPVVALNRDGQAYCWIDVPLTGSGPALRLDALDAVLATLDALHTNSPSPSVGAGHTGGLPVQAAY